MSKAVREAIFLVLVAVIVFLVLRLTIQTYVVYGPSMQPNFVEHERLIVSKVVYYFHNPQRGDVIVFKPPFTDKTNYIKRIIALPGESVEIKNGKTYIYTLDGGMIILDEIYVAEPFNSSYTKHTVPEGGYFVMGDNRNNSNDSRSGWMVPEDNIIGKAWLTIWPPDRWGVALNHRFSTILSPVFAR